MGTVDRQQQQQQKNHLSQIYLTTNKQTKNFKGTAEGREYGYGLGSGTAQNHLVYIRYMLAK